MSLSSSSPTPPASPSLGLTRPDAPAPSIPESSTGATNGPERVMPAWDVIPYEDVIFGPRLGKGAFGSVYKGTYLGLDIALKEVEASTTYKVEKYFEREWRIMRECRHPNIVQFLGLCHSPEEDGPVYIVSEYVAGGTLRQFIQGNREFPWRLRISFATDIARALAYLHARECLHRDLKGENLLVSTNDRVKMTDFGFARITTPDPDKKNMTYCGTDWYMSPEMMNGQPFGLPTDVFTLGILFAEISARRMVDLQTFQVSQAHHTLSMGEVHRLASPGCPKEFLALALDCCAALPGARPKMPEVIHRLRMIELDVLSRSVSAGQTEHIGSMRLVRPGHGGRGMPNFEPPQYDDHDDEAFHRMEEQAMESLSSLSIEARGAQSELSDVTEGSDIVTFRTARWTENPSDFSLESHSSFGHKDRLLREHTPDSHFTSSNTASSANSDWPQIAVQNASVLDSAEPPPIDSANGSVMTIRPPAPSSSEQQGATADEVLRRAEEGTEAPDPQGKGPRLVYKGRLNIFAPGYKPEEHQAEAAATAPTPSTDQIPEGKEPISDPKDQTDKTTELESEQGVDVTGSSRNEQEDEGSELQDRVLGTHRFTVITKAAESPHKKPTAITSALSLAFWTKPQGTGPKCKVCTKRLGQRPSLQCDDCGTTVHATCSHSTPRDCHLTQQSSV